MKNLMRKLKIQKKKDKTDDIKDSIVVKETENSEPIIYSIDGDSITSNKKQTSVDDNGKPNGHPTDDMKEITAKNGFKVISITVIKSIKLSVSLTKNKPNRIICSVFLCFYLISLTS